MMSRSPSVPVSAVICGMGDTSCYEPAKTKRRPAVEAAAGSGDPRRTDACDRSDCEVGSEFVFDLLIPSAVVRNDVMVHTPGRPLFGIAAMPLRFNLLLLLVFHSCLCGLNPVAVADDLPVAKTINQPDEKLNERLEKIVAKHKLPGLVAGILQGDQLISVGAAGVRKMGSPQRITVDDQMHLGSCTKAMTATRIAMLVQEGKLNWNSTLAEVFPDDIEQMHEDFQTVTLTQLLTHRAGLPPNPTSAWMVGAKATEAFSGLSSIFEKPAEPDAKSQVESRSGLVRTELKRPPKFKPGTGFQYSNLGYILAGAMAEQVTKQSWEDLMKDGLFKPLKMDSAGFGAPGTPSLVDQPWGHTVQLFGVSSLQVDNPRALGPAGTVHASIPDWARFAALHLAGARGSTSLLDLAQIQHLQTPPTDADYACGWVVYTADAKRSLASSLLVRSLGFDEEQLNDWTGGRALFHNGSNTLWLSWLMILPEKNLALMVVTNQFGPKVEKACGDTLRVLMEHYETEK